MKVIFLVLNTVKCFIPPMPAGRGGGNESLKVLVEDGEDKSE